VAGTNVIVTGSSTGTHTNGNLEFLTVKYDTDGHQLWADSYSVSANSYDTPVGLAADAAGNIYVLGRSTQQNQGVESVLVKYDANGQRLWSVRYDGPSIANASAYPSALALDGAGHVYVCGTAYLGPAYGDYLIKYDSEGGQLWVATYLAPGTSLGAYPTSLAVDASSNIYLAGAFGGYLSDYGTLKYDSAGRLLWAARYSGPGNGDDVAAALALDTNGNAYVTGRSWDANSQDDFATVK